MLAHNELRRKLLQCRAHEIAEVSINAFTVCINRYFGFENSQWNNMTIEIGLDLD